RQRVLPQAVEITGLDQVDRRLHGGHRAAAPWLRGSVLAVAGAKQESGEQGQHDVAQERDAHGWFLVVNEVEASQAALGSGQGKRRARIGQERTKGEPHLRRPPGTKRKPRGQSLTGKS